MRKVTYYAVVEPAAGGGFGVFFPDVPGCTSMAMTLTRPGGWRKRLLGLYLWGMEKDGDVIPTSNQPPFEDTLAGAVVAIDL
jgi:predicted RNase H-like HicB family nuclease